MPSRAWPSTGARSCAPTGCGSTLNVEFRDAKRSAMLWRRKGLQETSDFQVEGSVSDTVARGQGAVQQAATEIGRKVVNLALESILVPAQA